MNGETAIQQVPPEAGGKSGFFSLLFGVLRSNNIEPEHLEWAVGSGRQAFEEIVADFARQLIYAYGVVVIDHNTLKVNLDGWPQSERAKTHQVQAIGQSIINGWVTVQRRNDEVYVDDRKIGLFAIECQSFSPSFDQIKDTFGNLSLVHPNIIMALNQYQMIPFDWGKRYKKFGYVQSEIFFLATVYELAGTMYVVSWHEARSGLCNTLRPSRVFNGPCQHVAILE